MESNLHAPVLGHLRFQISLLRLMGIDCHPDSEVMAELEHLQEPFATVAAVKIPS